MKEVSERVLKRLIFWERIKSIISLPLYFILALLTVPFLTTIDYLKEEMNREKIIEKLKEETNLTLQ